MVVTCWVWKTAPSLQPSAMWTGSSEWESAFSLWITPDVALQGVFLVSSLLTWSICSETYLSTLCSFTSTERLVPCWIFQSASYLITPGACSLVTDGRRQSGWRLRSSVECIWIYKQGLLRIPPLPIGTGQHGMSWNDITWWMDNCWTWCHTAVSSPMSAVLESKSPGVLF